MRGSRRVSFLAAVVLAALLALPASAAAPPEGPGSLHPVGLIATPATPGVTAEGRALIDSVTAPNAVDLSAWVPPVGNQGSVGSCVSWATGYYARYWLRNRALGEKTLFAPMYLYSQIAQGVDRGSSFPGNFNILVSQGIAPRSVYTQGDYDYTTQPTPAQRTAAAPYRATSYARLFSGTGTGAQAAIQAAIASGQPVMLGIPVYPEFDHANSADPLVDVPKPGETSRGGHGVFAPKYDEVGVWIENSWGTGWGAAGWGHLTWAFVNGYAMEGWTLSSSTTDVAGGPSITTFTPTSGPAGTSVAIDGSGFTGATKVAFNGTSAVFAVASDTRITATVPAGATTGPIAVTGASATATSSSPFTVTGSITPTKLMYTGATSGSPGASVTLSATLTTSGGSPLSGRTVAFTLAGRSFQGTTSSTGSASVTATAPPASGSYTVSAAYAGDASYGASSASATLVVGGAPAATAITYTGPTSAVRGTPVALSAVLRTKTGTALAGKTLTFALGGKQASATTDARGSAAATLAMPTQRGIVTVTVSFAGGGGYAPSSVSAGIRAF